MNLKNIHDNDKVVSAVPVFKTEKGATISIRIKENGHLKEHISKVPALLVCLNGKAEFGDEQGLERFMTPGDYIEIEPMVKHWISAINESNFLLIKS
jgi:quercetin dioxygenase-like cupin family protein